jgi:hypothetical protein
MIDRKGVNADGRVGGAKELRGIEGEEVVSKIAYMRKILSSIKKEREELQRSQGCGLGTVDTPLIPALGKQRQVGPCEFKASSHCFPKDTPSPKKVKGQASGLEEPLEFKLSVANSDLLFAPLFVNAQTQAHIGREMVAM